VHLPVPIELRECERRGLGGRSRAGEGHAVLGESGRHQPAEPVAGQAPEERGCDAQPADGPGGVERPATGRGHDAAVRAHEEVSKRLAADDDHDGALAAASQASIRAGV
jgi:hypothetical protein